MNITWNTDVNAACCPGEIVADDGRTVLVQTDWDYCGVATTFGWAPRDVQRNHGECNHQDTHWPVACPDCGVTVQGFIDAAREYLRDHNGATADDPGYFEDARKGGEG